MLVTHVQSEHLLKPHLDATLLACAAAAAWKSHGTSDRTRRAETGAAEDLRALFVAFGAFIGF